MKIKEDNFFERVYEVARKIPYGKVTSYGAIAKALGAGRSARMVGWAMNASHSYDSKIPAHRVVNRIGLLTGLAHFNGQSMQSLLEAEGIIVINNQIQNFKDIFWDPETLNKDL